MRITSMLSGKRVVVACCAAGLGTSCLAPSSAAGAGLPIYVQQDATFRYVNATAATTVDSVPSNWFTPGFDDSSWFTGQGPFANSASISDLANASGPETPDVPLIPANTQWDTNLDPYLRTHFTLPAPTALTLWLAVDNGVNGFFFNGVQGTAAINAEGAAFRWEHVFDIPAEYTLAGDNLLAFQLEDHGQLTGFDLVLTADDSAVNPTFTTNEPPSPQPQNPPPSTVPLPAAAWSGLAMLAGLGVLRRLRGRRIAML